jgi:DedD protein
VTAVAVVLPMVLDSEPRPVSQNVDIQIPAPDSGALKPKAIVVAPVAPPPAAESTPIKGMPPAPKADARPAPAKAGAPEPGKVAAAPVAEVAGKPGGSGPEAAEVKDTAKAAPKEPAKAAPKEPLKEASKPAPKEPPKTAAKEKDASSASGVYVIQVAALADAARVKQLQKQMSAAGLKTYTESISTKTGEITRVRAGPYATREAAETARSQLKKAGLDGQVVAK